MTDGANRVRNFFLRLSALSWSHIIILNLCAIIVLEAEVILWFQFRALAQSAQQAQAVAQQNLQNMKRVSFSFDDVPRGPGAFLELDKRPQMLIEQLRLADIKQAAFYAIPGRNPNNKERIEAIAAYARAGHVIGNHTATHRPLRKVSAEYFLDDIDYADKAIRPLPNFRPWFRYPELDEGGRDHEKRDEVRKGLKARGIRNAYVTADGFDWYFDRRALDEIRSGRLVDREALKKLFVETHVNSLNFADKVSQQMLGRRPVQVLLLHETDLDALFIADLADALRKDGWQIVTADEAYKDPLAQQVPQSGYAEGTIYEMLAKDKGFTGNRSFPGSNITNARKAFYSQVMNKD